MAWTSKTIAWTRVTSWTCRGLPGRSWMPTIPPTMRLITSAATVRKMGRNCSNQPANTYRRHQFPPNSIPDAVGLYYLCSLSHRDGDDLLAERGITVSREAIRVRQQGRGDPG